MSVRYIAECLWIESGAVFGSVFEISDVIGCWEKLRWHTLFLATLCRDVVLSVVESFRTNPIYKNFSFGKLAQCVI